jgi:hypothetical protein
MTIRCKHCGADVTLTERESAQIAADLDQRFSWEQQAKLAFEAVCGDCWPEEERRAREAHARSRRVHFISATV